MKFLTASEINTEFMRLMREYPRYSWAVAWAGVSSECFQELMARKRNIDRMIVGTHFYQTHPDFIKAFMELDTVRFVPRTDELFHPKIYIFENGPSSWEIMIGSPNFTSAAFSSNTEAALLVRHSDSRDNDIYDSAKKLINKSWMEAERFDSKMLEAYAKSWQNKREHLKSLGADPVRVSSKPPYLSKIRSMTWSEFYDEARSDADNFRIRMDVLDIIRDIFERLHKASLAFLNLQEHERKAIAGTIKSNKDKKLFPVDMNWFGGMKGAGAFAGYVVRNNPKISRALDRIPFKGDVRKSDYEAFVTEFSGLDRCKLGTATRLLAMKRPDIFVCLDEPNLPALCRDFGVKESSVTLETYWTKIIEQVMESDWWRAPRPLDPVAAKVWDSRCALLDAIYLEE